MIISGYKTAEEIAGIKINSLTGRCLAFNHGKPGGASFP
jgi:hypothetical protein